MMTTPTRGAATVSRRPSVATTAHSFEKIMATLFGKLKLQVTAQAGGSAYCVRVDNTYDLHFFPDGEGFINVLANPVRVPDDAGTDCLLQLIALNNYAPMHPRLSVGINQDNRTVQISTRLPMAEVKSNEAMRLFKLMLNAIAHVNAIVTTN
jgi:hypothetical protein